MNNAYDRLEGESSKAYADFLTYLELGVDRSIEKVAKLVGKNESVLHRWRAKYKWAERAEAYDKVIEVERLEKMKRRALEANERHLKLAEELTAKGLKRLQKANLDKSNAGISISEARLMITSGVSMERDALGIAQNVNVNHTSNGKPILGVVLEVVENKERKILNDGLGGDTGNG